MFVEREVFGHRFVGIESEAVQAIVSGHNFSKVHEFASPARPLSRRMHRDVFDQQDSFRRGDQRDQTLDGLPDNPDLSILYCLRIVSFHRCGRFVHAAQVLLVRGGHHFLDLGQFLWLRQPRAIMVHRRSLSSPPRRLKRRCLTVPAIRGMLASVDSSEECDRQGARPLAQERSRLFDQQAEAYDRFRPTYPEAVIDELLGPRPAGLDVLDVGCGTGIASRQMAQRGAKVLGVELAPRMAEIARGHGIDVEIAAFEGWDAAGRTFDRVTSAQAWHWLDLPIATAKAASVLRPGGKLGLIWNAGCQPDDLADALEVVYATVVPRGRHRLFRGYAANRSSDVKTGLGSEIEAVSAVPDLGAPTEEWFPWTRAYRRDEWLDQLVSRSDHAALDPAVRDRLFEAIGAAIDDQGGSFVMNFETVLITATRLR